MSTWQQKVLVLLWYKQSQCYYSSQLEDQIHILAPPCVYRRGI